jgi:hypothetical protein
VVERKMATVLPIVENLGVGVFFLLLIGLIVAYPVILAFLFMGSLFVFVAMLIIAMCTVHF